MLKRLLLCLALCVVENRNGTAAPLYLNNTNITVALGPSMTADPFQNRTAAASLASVIDLPTAGSTEFHNQSTHVWVSGGTLELNFDLLIEYDLLQLHFWNYHSEDFDVDDIDFRFYTGANELAGTLFDVGPALGNNSGSDANPISAQTLNLSFPSKVRYVNAVLSGSNGQVDFNNLGFTAEVTPGTSGVPEPGTFALAVSSLIVLRLLRRR